MVAPRRIGVLLLASGFCAAVLALVWIRGLGMLFGPGLPATATALTVIFGAVALGSRAALLPTGISGRPMLERFGMLHGAAALWAALFPVFVWAARSLVSGGPISRVGIEIVAIGPAAFCLGAAWSAVRGPVLGHLTLGAAAAVALSVYALLPMLGAMLSLWIACALQLLIAVVARSMARTSTELPQDRHAPPSTRWVANVSCFGGGLAWAVALLCWHRLLGPLLGGSVQALGTFVAVSLVGVAAGGLLRGRSGLRATVGAAAIACALLAVALAAPFALGDRIGVAALTLRSFSMLGLGGHALGWTLAAVLVALPAAIAFGYLAELLMELGGSRRRGIGACTGGLATGAVVAAVGIPVATAVACWQLTTWVALIGAVALVGAGGRVRIGGVLALVSCGVAGVLTVGVAGPGAVTRHTSIGDGSADGVLIRATMNDLQRWLRSSRRATVDAWEGPRHEVAIRARREVTYLVDGTRGSGAISDAGTQVAGGLLAMLRHPSAGRVLVLGLETGAPAGWIARVSGVERVDVIEPEPNMRRVAAAFVAVNRDVLKQSNVHIVNAEPREALLARDDTYDVVLAMPSVAQPGMLTHEAYADVRARLNDGGWFAQVLHARDFDAVEARLLYATLRSVFAHVETWQLQRGDVLLLATDAADPIDAASARTRILQQPFADGFYAGFRAISLEDVIARHLAAPPFAESLATDVAELNGDDRNRFELGLARRAARGGDWAPLVTRELATHLGYQRPRVNGRVDWKRVDEAAMTIGMFEARPSPSETRAPLVDRETGHRFAALRAWTAGDLNTAAAAWSEQSKPPESPTEVMMMAEAYASVADVARATPLIAQLRTWEPVTAMAIEGRLHWRQKNAAEAVAKLTAAFAAYRTDPWATQSVITRAIGDAATIARADQELAGLLATAISEPFAAHSLHSFRTRVRLEIATRATDSAACVAALAEIGEHFPWERSLLVTRIRCLERTGHVDSGLARSELEQFVDKEGMAVDVAFVAPP